MTDKREISELRSAEHELRSAEHELRSAEQAEALWEHRMLHGTDPEPTAGVLHEEDWGTGTRTTIGPKDATMHTYVIEGTVTRAHVVWGRFEVKALTEEHARIVFEEAGGTGEQDLLAVATEIQGEDMEQGLDDPYEIDSIKEVD